MMMMMLATQAMKREKTEIGNERPDEAERLSDFNKKNTPKNVNARPINVYAHLSYGFFSNQKKEFFQETIDDWVWTVDYNKRKETIM